MRMHEPREAGRSPPILDRQDAAFALVHTAAVYCRARILISVPRWCVLGAFGALNMHPPFFVACYESDLTDVISG